MSQQTPNFLINLTIMNKMFNNEYLSIPSSTGSYYFTHAVDPEDRKHPYHQS